MSQSPKKPRKGAVAKLREAYNKLRKQPVSPELRDVLKKKDRPTSEAPLTEKKIAKTPKSDQDLDLP